MKKEFKLTVVILSILLTVFVVLLIGIYTFYNEIFPKAPKIDYPDYSLVESITVSEHEEPIYLSYEECRILYEYISSAKPTRIMSSNETPDTTPFFTVKINASDVSIYGYGYIYQKNGEFYFEIPYTGVYKLQI